MKFTLKTDATLLEAVMIFYHGISKQKAKQIISHSDFYVNDKLLKKSPTAQLKAGQVVEIVKSNQVKQPSGHPTHKKPVALYFEDDALIVALKPAGILSCSSKTEQGAKTFQKILEEYITERNKRKTRLYVVHRLDREVEGLIIFAKNETVQNIFKDNWPETSKKYLALLENKPEKDHFTIRTWLKDDENFKATVYTTEIPSSKLAITEYQFVRMEKNYCVVEITLQTGRKNQIRAHMEHLGFPIVGDTKYGARSDFKRQIRLAAYKLEFIHPETKKLVKLNYKPAKQFFTPSENANEPYKVI